MLANCRDIWERDYAHLALQKKVEKRDALEEWLYGRKEEDTYRRIPQVCAPYRLPGRPLGSTAHDQRRRRGQHTIFRKRCTVAGHKQLCKGHPMLYLPFAVAYAPMVGTTARHTPEACRALSRSGAARPDSDSLPTLNELIEFPEPTSISSL
jgi:hypothetical protein